MSKEDRAEQCDLDCTILFATQGLATLLLDKGVWTRMINNISAGKYMTPTRETMEYKLIPAEALKIQREQMTILSKSHNLTLSFDGGTSRGREAFWLFHASKSGGQVYMVHRCEATDESHTGEWIKEVAINKV
jgi:hypothetical protein